MSGTEGSWQGQVHRIVAGIGDGRARIDRGVVRDLVNTYLVRSLDMTALRFSIPVLLRARPGTSVILIQRRAGKPPEWDTTIEGVKRRSERGLVRGSAPGWSIYCSS